MATGPPIPVRDIIHDGGEVFKGEVGGVPADHEPMEGVWLHWLSMMLHKVYCLQ